MLFGVGAPCRQLWPCRRRIRIAELRGGACSASPARPPSQAPLRWRPRPRAENCSIRFENVAKLFSRILLSFEGILKNFRDKRIIAAKVRFKMAR
ncbi:Protein of unknown function, partial [Gryllus bimaculatus]